LWDLVAIGLIVASPREVEPKEAFAMADEYIQARKSWLAASHAKELLNGSDDRSGLSQPQNKDA
jgi:hypothetical protein